MPGEPDLLYLLARGALLDALTALEPHLDSIVVIGAQAVYLHTGPAALFVAKIHKIAERVNDPDRLVEKDALDVLRLLRTVPTEQLAQGLRGLIDSDLATT